MYRLDYVHNSMTYISTSLSSCCYARNQVCTYNNRLWADTTAAGSSFSSFFLADSCNFTAAADEDVDDTGVEVAGLTACEGVETDVLTTDEDADVVDDGAFTACVAALPCCDDAANNTTPVLSAVWKTWLGSDIIVIYSAWCDFDVTHNNNNK